MVLGLRAFVDRVGEGNGQPRLDANGGEEMLHVQPGVAIALGRSAPDSPGTLYITTKKVVWLSDANKNKGYAMYFSSISLFAVSWDPEEYPFPCIYTEIDTGDDDVDSGGSYEEYNQNTDLSRVTEMRLVPSDPSQLDALFDFFCQCADLNPDSDQDEDNEWFSGNEQMVDDADSELYMTEDLANPIGYANGCHDLSDTMLELQINDQRFDDAEESEVHGKHHQAPNHGAPLLSVKGFELVACAAAQNRDDVNSVLTMLPKFVLPHMKVESTC